jgi:hypothetical protein
MKAALQVQVDYQLGYSRVCVNKLLFFQLQQAIDER